MERINRRTHQDWNKTANLVIKRRAVENQGFTNLIPRLLFDILTPGLYGQIVHVCPALQQPIFHHQLLQRLRGLKHLPASTGIFGTVSQGQKRRLCLCSYSLKINWMLVRQLKPHRNFTARTFSFKETNWMAEQIQLSPAPLNSCGMHLLSKMKEGWHFQLRKGLLKKFYLMSQRERPYS